MNVKIEKLVYGGEGLGHQDGHTIFVPFVLPEEVVTIRPREKKKKFIRGTVREVVAASPLRTAATCRHFTTCGGCHYQHIPYEAQLEFKVGILRETLARLGRIEWSGPIHTHASPPLRYRNRAQWKVRRMGNALRIGYFQTGTTALCPAEECPVLAPELEQMLGVLADMASRGALPESLREVEAFVNGDGRALLNVSLGQFPSAPALLAATLSEALTNVETVLLHEAARDRFELTGPGFITYRVNGRDYRVGHLSFFQANRFLLDELVSITVGSAAGALALDLYCGVGLFTLHLAASFERVIAVESNAAAVRDLESNLGSTGGRVHVMQGPVEQAVAVMDERPGVIVLDPPRTGVEGGAISKVLALEAPEIRYLSCDPATLARDLSALTPHGYAIAELHLFDLFPQTYHLETLAVLRRAS
jgi:23S rRNA (uracil1939-C5)-methyltransferase